MSNKTIEELQAELDEANKKNAELEAQQQEALAKQQELETNELLNKYNVKANNQGIVKTLLGNQENKEEFLQKLQKENKELFTPETTTIHNKFSSNPPKVDEKKEQEEIGKMDNALQNSGIGM